MNPEKATRLIEDAVGEGYIYNSLEHSGGQDTGEDYLLFEPGDEPFYTCFASRSDALDWLAQCISEGSTNLYNPVDLIQVTTSEAERIDRLTAQGFETVKLS